MIRVFLPLALLAFVACGRASEEDCRKAVVNMQKLRSLDTDDHAPDIEAMVRQCRATANPKTVACIVAAKTAPELDACEAKK